MNWFGNHTGIRAPEVVKAGKVARSLLVQLVVGGVQKRRISKALPHHAYLHMFRDRVMPIIKAEWSAKKSADPDLDSNQALAFTNRRLQQMLAAEPQDVRDRVEVFREDDLKRRLKEDDDDNERDDEIVVPDADLLSREEVARRKIGLTRQQYVSSRLSPN